MFGEKDSQFRNSASMNNATFNDYMYRFMKIATSIFEWENLPESCSAEYLEYCLYAYGSAAFLYDNNIGFINTKAVPNGELNIYGLPTKINCYSFNYQEIRDLYSGLSSDNEDKDKECVLIRNNFEMVPTESTIRLFCTRLYEVERSLDTNIKAQKTPILLLCDEKQRLTLKNLYMKYDGNQPFIFSDKDLFTKGSTITSIKTDAPYLADKLMEYKRAIWNEALTFLGINNVAEEKKERLVTDEASGNNELINMNLNSYFKLRKKACEEINRKYGLNVNVKVNSDLANIIKTYDSTAFDLIPDDEEIEKEGVEEDG